MESIRVLKTDFFSLEFYFTPNFLFLSMNNEFNAHSLHMRCRIVCVSIHSFDPSLVIPVFQYSQSYFRFTTCRHQKYLFTEGTEEEFWKELINKIGDIIISVKIYQENLKDDLIKLLTTFDLKIPEINEPLAIARTN